MENIVSGLNSEKEITLKEFSSQYRKLKYNQSYMANMANDPQPLISATGKSKRFGNIKLKYYVNEVNQEKEVQFSAVTFILDYKHAVDRKSVV